MQAIIIIIIIRAALRAAQSCMMMMMMMMMTPMQANEFHRPFQDYVYIHRTTNRTRP